MAANDGVNCITCPIGKPSTSIMTMAPQICDKGSTIEPNTVNCMPRKRSTKGTFEGFHFSEKNKKYFLENIFYGKIINIL